jgi:hypothetical protein
VASLYDDQDPTDGVETLGKSLIDDLAVRTPAELQPCGSRESPGAAIATALETCLKRA